MLLLAASRWAVFQRSRAASKEIRARYQIPASGASSSSHHAAASRLGLRRLPVLGAGLVAPSAGAAPQSSCSCKPSAKNTEAHGTRSASKVRVLAKSGQSLANVSLKGSLTVSGNNIVVRNVSVKGKIHITGDHVTLDRVTATNVVDSGGSNLTVKRSNLTGGGTAGTHHLRSRARTPGADGQPGR